MQTSNDAEDASSVEIKKISNHKDSEDVVMSDADDSSSIEIRYEMNQKESEDAVMSDAEEDLTDLPPSSPPTSHPRPSSQMVHTNVPSSSSPSPISSRTPSATKLDQVPSGRVLKKSIKIRPAKKAKIFTEQQQMALLNAAATEHHTAATTSLDNSQTLSSPSTRPPTSRKTRPAKELNQLPSTKIHKGSNKDKPRKKAKTFTEEQTQILLHAATSSYHSTHPTSPGMTVTEAYPNDHTSANKDTMPSPGSPIQTSRETPSTQQLDHIPSGKAHNKINQNKPVKKAKTLPKQQSPAQTNAASANSPPTSSSTLRRSERLKNKAAAGKAKI